MKGIKERNREEQRKGTKERIEGKERRTGTKERNEGMERMKRKKEWKRTKVRK